MPDCDREDSPETAALFENYSQRRVLKATYEEKKDRFAKEAEALQEEKDRIAQELRKVDTKYNALQAKLAQLSAGYEADKTGLSHSLRRMLCDIAVTPGSPSLPNPLPTSNDTSIENVQVASCQLNLSQSSVVEVDAPRPTNNQPGATRTGRVSRPPRRYSSIPATTSPARPSPDSSTKNTKAAARGLSSQPGHRTVTNDTPPNNRAKRDRQCYEESPGAASGHARKKTKTAAATEEPYTVDFDEVFQDGLALHKHMIIQYPQKAIDEWSEENGGELITHPLEGKPYLGYWRSGSRGQGWHALVVLPLGRFDAIGLHGSLLETELAKSIPACYDRQSATDLPWAEGYRDGERLVAKRRFPVMWFLDDQTFPLRKDLMMPTPAWYNWLAASDLRPFSPICETEGSKLARGHYGALEYANQRKRLKVAGPRCNVESNDSLMASTGLSPAQGYISVAGNAADEEHENQHLESVDDGTSTKRGLVDVFDIDIEASRDSSQSHDVEGFELDSCRTRRPSITVRPIDVSDFHPRCGAGDEGIPLDGTDGCTADEPTRATLSGYLLSCGRNSDSSIAKEQTIVARHDMLYSNHSCHGPELFNDTEGITPLDANLGNPEGSHESAEASVSTSQETLLHGVPSTAAAPSIGIHQSPGLVSGFVKSMKELRSTGGSPIDPIVSSNGRTVASNHPDRPDVDTMTNSEYQWCAPRSLLAHTAAAVLQRVSAQPEPSTLSSLKTGLSYVLNRVAASVNEGGTAEMRHNDSETTGNMATSLTLLEPNTNLHIPLIGNNCPHTSRPSSVDDPPVSSAPHPLRQGSPPQAYPQMANGFDLPHQAHGATLNELPRTSMFKFHPQPMDPAPVLRSDILSPVPDRSNTPEGGIFSPDTQSSLIPRNQSACQEDEQPINMVKLRRYGIFPTVPQSVVSSSATISETTVVPQKDAYGKFPCPHCTKTYIHVKHLKRHLLRHTGDRPYMCVLCRDTFSRSDILKRHFLKCSITKGNPTGASHLSHLGAHVRNHGVTQQESQEGERDQVVG
ncbi:fungal-specific transcription factor domain-containing protein [Apiospora kogelbergensis]|uniref:fungal-specific transcription factor domain-containing protein n=1 Tax=Apiospora kogelbergensis TaxID=1337665 RepID=UPI003130CA2C